MKAAHVFLTGDVQGVFFRAFTKMNAQKLGLRGFARNLQDGRLEVWIESGDDNRLFEMLRLLKRGPEGARVSYAEIRWEKPKRYAGFEILR